jgi:hypothetical protein
MAINSTKSVSAVGFSNGWAELTLKNPPPFVPSCLIAIWLATGPRAIVCPNPWMPVTTAEFASVCVEPCTIRMIATTTDSGIRM